MTLRRHVPRALRVCAARKPPVWAGQTPSRVLYFGTMNAIVETTEVAMLGRVLRPDEVGWSVEAARAILDLRFPPADVDRMKCLAEKAQAGSLCAQEESELENYRHVGRLLDLMKSRARKCVGSAVTN